MPFDAQPLAPPELSGFKTPSEAAEGATPGMVSEPVLAAVIAAVRAVTEVMPASPR
jgi:hypothetical protein